MTKCSANYLSEKGKLKIEKDGFFYTKDRELSLPGTTSWYCDLKTKTKCRRRLHMSGDVIIKFVGEHNHAGDASKTPVLIALQALRERATTTQEPTQSIIAETTTNIPDSSAAQLPSKFCMKRTVQRARRYDNF